MKVARQAIFVFCEGPHDVAFVYHVATKMRGFCLSTRRFEDFPAPFHRFFISQVREHAMKDLSLDMAHKFYLPDSILEDPDGLILFLFNSGGKSQVEKIKDFIGKLQPLLNAAKNFPAPNGEYIESASYIFLYDADHNTAGELHRKWYDDFRGVAGNVWLDVEPVLASQPMGAYCGQHKAVYIWCGSEDTGTLEDIVLPIVASSKHCDMDGLRSALESFFEWDLANRSVKTAVANKAKLLKSLITLAGQHRVPGASMNVVIRHGKLITKEGLEQSTIATDFSQFLADRIGALATSANISTAQTAAVG